MRKKLLSVLLTLVMIVSVFGSFAVIASAENAVAQVIASNGNATDYTTFEDAWKAAVNYRATFKLLSDWRVSGNFGASGGNAAHQQLFFNGGALSVMPGFSVTIDLNGYKICRNKGVNNMTDDGSVIRLFDGASITINDTSKNQNGSIEGGSSNYGGGNLEIDSDLLYIGSEASYVVSTGSSVGSRGRCHEGQNRYDN